MADVCLTLNGLISRLVAHFQSIKISECFLSHVMYMIIYNEPIKDSTNFKVVDKDHVAQLF